MNTEKLTVEVQRAVWLHITVLIVVGILSACIGAHGAYLGKSGLFGILTAVPIFFILGTTVAHSVLLLSFRLLSLVRYLRIYGFSSKGLNADSSNDECEHGHSREI